MSKESLITLCFKTDDASYRDDASARFQFPMHADRAKLKPSKISLGSLEFPMVQYSVEADWSRLYFCESIKITMNTRNITFTEVAGQAQTSESVSLPLTLNPITKLSTTVSAAVVFEFEHAHCLSTEMFNALGREGIKLYLIHSSDGATELSQANTSVVSEKQISISSELARNASDEGLAHGFLYCEEVPCPTSLCSILKHMLFATGGFAHFYSLTFDQKACKAVFAMTAFGAGTDDCRIVLGGDALLQRLGYGSNANRFVRRGNTHTTGVATRGPERVGDPMPVAVESTIFGGFDYISLPAGWYMPSHRPMATGQPLQLPRELDAKLNRFTFLPSDKQREIPIIFKDFRGKTHIASITPGIYTVATIALEVERVMNSVDLDEGMKIVFVFDPCDERFIVSCHRGDESMRIDLLFSHPFSIDPERFGFKKTDYAGHSSYKSDKIHIPRLEWPRRDWCNTTDPCVFPSNTYSISEHGPCKRISVDANAKPNVYGIIKDYWQDSHILVISVCSSAGAFSHGAQSGDVLRVYKLTNPIKQQSGNTETSIAPAHLACRRAIMAICISNLSTPGDSQSSDTLKLYIPDHEWKSKIETCIGVDMQTKPFNLNFAKMDQSITGKRLGFQNKIYEWGVDGSLLAGGVSIAPYTAPYVHAIDHPDYVLMYIEEGKQGTTIQHRSGNNVTMPFAKIVLYPLFREERMIPKETTLTSGESLTTLTIYFRNPDDSPYNFHGAEFSFTLNFIV
tara:strand:- start:3681 stop:5900 length:2220 start_codon:yes stop_codon:yes gene_type:complete